MLEKENLLSVINTQLHILQQEQHPQGAYLSLTSTQPQDFSQAEKKFSLFPTALILSSLSPLKSNPIADTIAKKITAYLLTQKTDYWSFNYWEKHSPDAEKTPYPDDLDDTACCLSALYLYDPSLITGEVVAHFVSLLTFVEAEEGGPYKTWIVPDTADKAWQDIDLAVNSNIAYFLSLQDVTLDSLDTLIDQAIEKKKFVSPYYSYEFSLLYFITRSYSGKRTQELIEYLLSKQIDQQHWGSALDTALCITTLLRLGYPVDQLEKSITYLLNTEWNATAFCTELITSETTYYSGSKALTIAFCLEALQSTLDHLSEETSEEIAQDQTKMYSQQVYQLFKDHFSFLSNDCLNAFNKVMKKMTAIDGHQKIVLLPYVFANSIRSQQRLDNHFLQQLSLANLSGWVAYTIYDDFFDQEGNTEELSLANIALRTVVDIYSTHFFTDSAFKQFFTQTMNTLDQANLWETLHCHKEQSEEIIELPDFGAFSVLAEKSMGHALGPLAILAKYGYPPSSKEFQLLSEFFVHYIISRQLNDDIHDWEEDLKQGMLTPVHSTLLKQWKKETKKTTFTLEEVMKDLPILQQSFWHHSVVELCERILFHVQSAKEVLSSCTFLSDTSLLEDLLQTAETSAQSCLSEREKTVEFLEHYSKSSL